VSISRFQAGVLVLALFPCLTTACGGATTTTPVITGTATPVDAEALTLGDAVEGDTTDRDDTSSPTCGEPDGAGDQAWAFTPEADGWYRFHVEAGYDAVLSVRDDTGGELSCNDDGESKRDAEVSVQLIAGRTYTVMVDGFRDSEGSYRLIAEGSEAAVPEGRRGLIHLDQPVSDATTDGSDTVTPACGATAGSRDHVWHFVAPTAGSYRFLVESEYDSVIALIDQAGAALDCNDDFQSDTRRSQVTRVLEAGASIGVVVDGYSGGEGPYRLTVSSLGGGGPSAQGGGTVVVGTPVNGTTTGGQDHYTPSCGAATSSPDDVWQLTPTQAGTYRIHVDSQYDAVVSLTDESGAEVACNDDLNSTAESEVVVGLQAGRTYNVVVDGYNGATGGYTLTVTPEAGGAAPQNPTVAPTAFTSSGTIRLGRPISDSTAGGADMVQVGCNSAAGTPDDIWELTVPRRSNYQVHVASQYDSVVALLDAQHTELVCNDDHRTTRESLVRSRLEPGQTYYVVVSGYQSEVGSYVLTVRREPKPGRGP
jgi:hypothetical protein